MTLCERCGNYPNICGCAEADALEARLAEAEARIARLLEITESCESCFLDARATVSAELVQK